MDSKRKSVLNSSKPGTPVGNKRASMAKTPKVATPKPTMSPKVATPALSGNQRRKSAAADLGNGSAKKRKSMVQETPNKKKTPVKVVEPEEDSDESDDDMSDEMHSDEGGSDIVDEEGSGAESEDDDDDAEEEEDDDSEEEEKPKPQQKKAKQDNKKTTGTAPNKPKKKDEEKQLSNPEQTIFVGNLPKEITQDKIKKMFSKYGKISSVRLRSAPIEDPRVTKKVAVIKKQFHKERTNINAYVVFNDKDSARNALKENGTEMDGHRIRVDMAKQNKPNNKLAIFVGNLAFDAVEDELHGVFSSCGSVSSIRIIRDKGRGIGKGFAYVNFESTDAVELALLKDGTKVHDRAIRVCRSQEKSKRRVKGFKAEKSDKGKKGAMQKRKPKPRSMAKAGDKGGSPKKTNSPAASFQGQKADQGKVTKKRNRGKKDVKKQAAIETLVKSLPGSAKKTKA